MTEKEWLKAVEKACGKNWKERKENLSDPEPSEKAKKVIETKRINDANFWQDYVVKA